MKKTISKLLEMGMKFIPLNGKIPTEKNWVDTEYTDTEIIEASKHNWGINCGRSNILVLDVDQKLGKNGKHELEALEMQYTTLPDTFTVATPSGGRHYYFKGAGKTSTGKIASCIDTRGYGGQVVSPLVKGYEIIHDVPIAPPPAWLTSLLDAGKTEEIDLESLEIPVGERNATLAREAGFLRGRGYNEDQIMLLLREINENNCEEPVSEEELQIIGHSVARYKSEDAKEKAKAKEQREKILQEFEDYKVNQGDSVPVRSFEYQGHAKDREWIIQDWLPVGEISSIYGAGGSGKSLLGLQLGYAVAYNQPWLNLKIEQSMPVLGIFCEDSNDELHRRLNNVRSHLEVPLDGRAEKGEKNSLYLWSRVGQDTALVETKLGKLEEGKFYMLVEEYLAQMPEGNKLLILDTLSDVFMASENDREIVNRFIKYHIGRLAQQYQLTVILIAHPSRAGVGGGDLLSGSTAWENSVRGRWVFSPNEEHEDEGIMSLRRQKSNYASKGEELLVRWSKGVFVRAEETVLQLVAEEDQIAVEYLAEVVEANGDISVNEAAAIFAGVHGKSKKTWSRTIKEILVKYKENLDRDYGIILKKIGQRNLLSKRVETTSDLLS